MIIICFNCLCSNYRAAVTPYHCYRCRCRSRRRRRVCNAIDSHTITTPSSCNITTLCWRRRATTCIRNNRRRRWRWRRAACSYYVMRCTTVRTTVFLSMASRSGSTCTQKAVGRTRFSTAIEWLVSWISGSSSCAHALHSATLSIFLHEMT